LILHPGKFGKNQIEPLYNAWLTQALESIAEDANRDLADIINHSLLFETNDDSLEHDHTSERYSDLAILATTGTAGFAAIPTVITVSTVSAGGVLGVIGVTAISWPIVLAGIAVTGVLFAVSGHRAAKLKTKAIERYKKKIQKVIRNKVLGEEYRDASICRNLQTQVIDTASNILAEVDHA
jgi:hypothetical protein